MQQGELRILVAGAGIAGLATARALTRAGFTADVVERSPHQKAIGAGLYLPGNASRALRALGLGDAVEQRATPIPRQVVADHRGRRLFDIDLETVWGGAGPCLALHRAELHQVLSDGVPVRAGVGLRDLADDGRQVTAEFTDGSRGRYDLVIGADGVHSTVRRLLFGAAGVRPVGQLGWRFVLDGVPGVDTWSVMLGRGTAFLTIPIGDGRVYCYADTLERDDNRATSDPVSEIRGIFNDFAEPVPGVLSELGDGHTIHTATIEEVMLDSWSRGRVLLIGDAAHATSPNMAQGAAMALEDALVLAEVLTAEPTVAAAIKAFEARRRHRTDWVCAQTHRRDHARNLAPRIRDLTLRTMGRRMFRGNYAPLVGPF